MQTGVKQLSEGRLGWSNDGFRAVDAKAYGCLERYFPPLWARRTKFVYLVIIQYAWIC